MNPLKISYPDNLCDGKGEILPVKLFAMKDISEDLMMYVGTIR